MIVAEEEKNKIKKLIYFIAVIYFIGIFILNILCTSNLDKLEHITINFNNIYCIIGLIIIVIIIFLGNKILNNKINKSQKSKFLCILSVILFFIFNVIWCIMVRPAIVGDQIHACNLAQTFYSGNEDEFLHNMTYAGIPLIEYIQAYHQQISLGFVFSVFLKIIHFDVIEALRVLNIIGNVIIVITLLKINNHLSKTYKTNKTLLLFLITTFFSLIMLSTFVYGDIPSIALCLLNVYLMMSYVETKKYKFFIGASISTMIAYMMRMNSLIFIIATVIYLIFNLSNKIKINKFKDNVIQIAIILIYITVSIIPSNLVKAYYINKYNLDNDKAYPNASYFLMAMEESPRANGWYSESIGEPALKNPREKEIEYVDKIKERLAYFKTNIYYACDFYIKKITSMWTENTYSAIQNNNVEYISLEGLQEPLILYQKSILVFMCICCCIILIQQRKNISLELLFLVTIFIGGFSFHILWEAKSRYIIPYIIVLMPISCINISKISFYLFFQRRNKNV